jgi:hypothetical protein
VGARLERPAVDGHGENGKLVPVEDERRIRAPDRVRAERERRRDPRLRRMEPDVELDPIDQEVAGAVILQADNGRRVGAHRRLEC